jgi:hypothetical protein
MAGVMALAALRGQPRDADVSLTPGVPHSDFARRFRLGDTPKSEITMLKNSLRAALVLAAIASPALADGPGIVTDTQAGGGNNPTCEIFWTGTGPTAYGFGLHSAMHEHMLSAILISATPGLNAPVRFDLVPDPECANGITGVAHLGLGK